PRARLDHHAEPFPEQPARHGVAEISSFGGGLDGPLRGLPPEAKVGICATRNDPQGAGDRRRMASARSAAFWTLPEDVVGRSSTMKTRRGILKLAMRPRHHAISSAAATAAASWRITN